MAVRLLLSCYRFVTRPAYAEPREDAAAIVPFTLTACSRSVSVRALRPHASTRTLRLLLVLLLGGCAAKTTDPAVIDDARLAARVKTAIVNDPAVGAYAIEVRVASGVASLSGRVPTQADIARVVEIARGVEGITNVRANLQIGADPSPAVEERLPPGADSQEPDSPPGLLAVGVSVAWSNPNSSSLQDRLSLGPLFKLGSAAGFGPAIGFDWYQAELAAAAEATDTRIRVKPVMGGVAFTWRGNRVSLSPSVVAGYAFNSLSVGGTGVVTATVPVDVGNSFAWRVGTSAWFDVTRRVAMNVSAGRLMTGLRITVLEDGHLVRRNARGDTVILRAGLAYRIF
jgi:hypothetical protein